MFLTLGLLVFPSHLASVALNGTILALVLVFVARPVAVAVATLPFAYSWRERSVLGWAGLRGAVPVVLATFPVIEHVSNSVEFFNIVFFAVLVSTVLQGSTLETLARRLGLTTNQPALPRPLSESGTIRRLGAEVLEYTIASGDAIAGARVRDLGLPRDAVVSVIVREEQSDPTPRLDPAARRRRAPSSDQRGVRSRHPRPPDALANRTDRTATTASSPDSRAPADLHRLVLERAKRRGRFTSANHRRRARNRTAAHPPRPTRRPLGARRRPLRDNRTACGSRLPTRPHRMVAATDAQRHSR